MRRFKGGLSEKKIKRRNFNCLRETRYRPLPLPLPRWGLIPYWVKDPKGGAQPINATSETVKTNGHVHGRRQSQRALMSIDGFFEWKDILGPSKNKQP